MGHPLAHCAAERDAWPAALEMVCLHVLADQAALLSGLCQQLLAHREWRGTVQCGVAGETRRKKDFEIAEPADVVPAIQGTMPFTLSPEAVKQGWIGAKLLK